MELLLYDREGYTMIGALVNAVTDRLRKLGKLRSIYLSANPGSSRHKGIRFDRQALLDCIEACRQPETRCETRPTDLAAAMERGEKALRNGRPARASTRA